MPAIFRRPRQTRFIVRLPSSRSTTMAGTDSPRGRRLTLRTVPQHDEIERSGASQIGVAPSLRVVARRSSLSSCSSGLVSRSATLPNDDFQLISTHLGDFRATLERLEIVGSFGRV